MSNPEREQKWLGNVDSWYRAQGFYARLVEYFYSSFKPHFKKGLCLELGCSDGIMTNDLVKDFKKVVAVDGSAELCEITKNKVKVENLKVICALFEEYETDEKFDTIIMAHILEHVKDPVLICKKAKNWLRDESGGNPHRCS